MGDYYFIASSISVFLLINLVIVSFPSAIQSSTGLNTTALQNDTDLSANVQANQTTESNVVDQAGSLVNVYSNPTTQNRYLSSLFLLYVFLMIAWAVDKIWIG